MVRTGLAMVLAFACLAGCASKAPVKHATSSALTEYALTDKPGTVAPDTKVNLPGGKGAFPTTVDTGAVTGATPAITVTAGFSYTFACVVPGDSAKLVFGLANPIAGGDAVQVSVTARIKNFARHVIFTKVLPKTAKNQKVVYRTYTVPLPATDDCMELTLWTKAISGGTGAWAMFVGPTVKGLPESQP